MMRRCMFLIAGNKERALRQNPTIAAGYVNGVLAFAASKGADRAALIAQAGLD